MEEILYQKISVYSEFFFPWKVSSLCLTQRQKKENKKKTTTVTEIVAS